MNLVEIRSLFTFQTEGQNFQKIIEKFEREVWLRMGVKDAIFIYFSEYITFMPCARVEQFQKCEK